ncbi:Ribokinase [Candidatus Entotheonellaceae bacterium PAL068K]
MTRSLSPCPVVIDTDPGVDDALALMLALRSPELRVELITTVAGNVPVQTATANARRLLALINPSTVPILAQGAARPLRRLLHTATVVHGADGLGGLTQLRRPDGSPRYPLPQHPVVRRQAVQRLLRLVQIYGADLTVIAMGPLTNIARAMQQQPETMQRLGRLLIMGGAISVPGNVNPTAEFNMFVDPHAAAIVFASGLPIILVPLDITRQVRLTPEFFQHTVRGPGTTLAQAARQMTRHLLRGSPAAPGLALHDPLTVAIAAEPSLVRLTPFPVSVETQGRHTMGMTVADRRDATRWSPSRPRLEVALEVDAPRALALFAERVLSRQTPRPRPRPPARVVVVGSANTDLTVRAAHLPAAGETVLGDTLYTSFGGKGANQALAARRAGAQVSLLAKLGQDAYGQDYIDYLQRQDLDVSGVQRTSKLPSGVALITVDRGGQNQISVAPGANAAFLPSDLHDLEARLTSARVLLTHLEIPLATVEAVLRRAKATGLITILNPAPARRLPVRLIRLIDILVPNEAEAALLCGKPVRTLPQAHTAARLLRQAGYGTVIMTLGKRGLVYTDDTRTIRLPGHAVRATDATAAGDTFVGYLASALAAGHTMAAALIQANAAAAITVTRAGAQPAIPHCQEVQQFLLAPDLKNAECGMENKGV